MLRKPLPIGVAVGPFSAQPQAAILGTGGKLLPLNAGMQCGGNGADALGNFAADAITGNQNCFHKNSYPFPYVSYMIPYILPILQTAVNAHFYTLRIILPTNLIF